MRCRAKREELGGEGKLAASGGHAPGGFGIAGQASCGLLPCQKKMPKSANKSVC